MSVLLITGGARGIGRSISEVFLENKWSVVSLSRNKHAKAVAELSKKAMANNVKFHHACCDIADLDLVEKTIKNFWSLFNTGGDNGLKIVINNAAVLGPVGVASETSFADWKSCFSINLFAPVFLARFTSPIMQSNGGGTLINISGGGGAKAQPYCSAYSTAKAALVRFTEEFSEELKTMAPTVACFSVAPGFVATDIYDQVMKAGEDKGKDLFRFVKKMLREGQGNDPKKTARLCLRLTDPELRCLSGRFFSGAFDTLDTQESINELKGNPDIFTLRRIDNFTFKNV